MLSETATTDGTCNAGPVTLTVTPGRTAPVVSVMIPTIPAVLCAAPDTVNARAVTSTIKLVSTAPDDGALRLDMGCSLTRAGDVRFPRVG